jgi:hypothetical protein
VTSIHWVHRDSPAELRASLEPGDDSHMAEYVGRLRAGVQVPRPARAHLYLLRTAALAFIAIGVSGAVCGFVRYRYGDHTLAADSQSQTLSAARCADLLEYHPEKTNCSAAELAHHADEVVEYRLGAGVMGLLAMATYFIARSRLGLTDGERLQQEFRYLASATAAFALAAAMLIGVGVGVQFNSGEAAPRWFSDGGVALAFFVLHAAWLLRTRPTP